MLRALKISFDASRRHCRRRAGGTLAGLLGFFLLLLAGPTARAAEGAVSKEYQLKAAFLYNFTKFVEWPAARFAEANSPIVIGVLGQNPFGGELEKITEGRTVNGRAIVVKVITTAEEASTVHLLFVPRGEETRLPAAVWQSVPIVAVGESDSFAALGGTIMFTREADKIRFEINIAAAERSRLKISAQLQKLAIAVRRKP
ncbi:MAG TPA: YfiR family protein [Opitutaceae bacterium]|nr:YfiR family protein [Opitutaceae bacterium]